MTRPDYCPIGGEPCQSLCDTPCSSVPRKKKLQREHDPNHPYVRSFRGCGHGRLFTEPCQDCEIVNLHDEYRRAVRTVQRVRDRLRVLGSPLPGNTSASHKMEQP